MGWCVVYGMKGMRHICNLRIGLSPASRRVKAFRCALMCCIPLKRWHHMLHMCAFEVLEQNAVDRVVWIGELFGSAAPGECHVPMEWGSNLLVTRKRMSVVLSRRMCADGGGDR